MGGGTFADLGSEGGRWEGTGGRIRMRIKIRKGYGLQAAGVEVG